jgi:enoyl-[acyl-carrier protein] reductase I
MTSTGSLMAGRRGLVMGVANDRSIAWGIAKACAAQGAELAFTFQGEALEKRVRPLAAELGVRHVLPADVTDPASLDAVFSALELDWGGLDFVVHAIAYSDKEELKGHYVDTTRANFLRTLDISCFSFTDLCRRAAPLMKNGGSLLTLSYYGAERVMPHYNVMGVAKAALEASVRYLAASGIGDFRYILKWNELNAPLRRNVTTDEVGNAGLYLLSDLGAGVTGETHHVDCGYHVVGMMAVDAAPQVSEMLAGFKPQK